MYDESEIKNEKDKAFLDGFDWALEMAVDNFFNNNFLKGLDDDSYIGHFMSNDLPDSLKGETEIDFKYLDREPETRKILTVADYVRDQILDWCDGVRRDLIISMVESKDGEED